MFPSRHLLLGLILLTPLLLPGGAAAQLPSGWEVRPDQGGHLHTGSAPEGLDFVVMEPGWHVTTGPAVILWRPEDRGVGNYRVEVDLHLFDPGRRREAFGLFIGGSELHGEGQRYSYFLVRNGGEFLVKRRAGGETPTVVDWTGSPAIRRWEDRGDGQSVLNHLAVEVRGDGVTFLVNGEKVSEHAAGELDREGIVGLRVNHGLDLHVSRFELTPLR